MRKYIVSFVEISVLLACSMTIGAMYIAPSGMYVATPIDRAKLLVMGMALLGIVGAFLYWRGKREERLGYNARLLILAVVMCVTVALQLVYAFNAYKSIWGWDCQSVVLWNHATWEEAEYYLRYPNNIMVAYIFKYAEMLGEILGINDVWLSAVLANVLFTDIAMFLMFRLAEEAFSEEAYIITIFLGTAMISLSPEILVPYTDTIGMMFPLLGLILIKSICHERRTGIAVIEVFALAMVTYLGYLIKPTTLIVWVACILGGILMLDVKKYELWKRLKVKKILAICAAFALGICVVNGVKVEAQNAILGEYNTEELKDAYEFPMSHFIMMGLKDGGGCYGGWNGDDYTATLSITGKAEKAAYNFSEIEVRIKEMGVGNFLLHLLKKYIFVTIDGTFYYGAEGSGLGIPDSAGLRYLLQQFTHPDTVFFSAWYGQFLHAIWLVTLLGVAIFSVKHIGKNRNDVLGLIIQFAAIGIIAFTVLFEGRSRYLYMFLPFFIMTAARGFGEYKERHET